MKIVKDEINEKENYESRKVGEKGCMEKDRMEKEDSL